MVVDNTLWYGRVLDALSENSQTRSIRRLNAKVGADAYLLMGDPAGWSGKIATQTGLWVWSTQTVYSFSLGDAGLNLNLTFTSPLLTEDRELLSRPAHYITFDTEAVGSAEYAAGEVELYFDVTGRLVMLDSMP